MTYLLEHWKPVVEFVGYEVSNTGRIRKIATGQFVKSYRHQGGYPKVHFGKHLRSVHTVVIRAFLGEQRAGIDVNHLDGNKGNNALSNLEYLNRTAHIRHSIAMGLHDRGHKLEASDIPEIRRLLNTMFPSEVAKLFGVTDQCIRMIVRGETWKHVA